MHQADTDAAHVLERLAERLATPTIRRPASCCAPGVLVGVEVEVPWSAYFPTLWEQYFLGGTRRYEDFSAAEQEALTAACTQEETTLLPRLEATIACGIERGKDRYWEFALPPANDLSLTWSMLEMLASAGLLPGTKPFSMHATVSGDLPRRHALAMLFLLELLFGRKERLEQGFKGRGSWARKGRGGYLKRDPCRMRYGMMDGFELRTLELPTATPKRARLFDALAAMTHCVADEARMARIHRQLEALLARYGLPYAAWGNPTAEPSIWRTYLDAFDALRLQAFAIAKEDLDAAA